MCLFGSWWTVVSSYRSSSVLLCALCPVKTLRGFYRSLPLPPIQPENETYYRWVVAVFSHSNRTMKVVKQYRWSAGSTPHVQNTLVMTSRSPTSVMTESQPLRSHQRYIAKQVEKSFLQNEGGYRDSSKLQKERNKEWLLSKATYNYMTPSLYLCR